MGAVLVQAVLLLALTAAALSSHSAGGLVEDSLHPEDKALAGGAHRRPLIYVYDFGQDFYGFSPGEDMSASNPNYALVQVFPELLLQAKQHITSDPAAADYFLVRSWPGFPQHAPKHFTEIVQRMRAVGGWWDRKGGADHIILWPNDEGRCAFADSNAILITHFGRLSDYQRGLPCYLDKTWGAKCDPSMAYPPKYRGCHRLDHDIVVPPTLLEFQPNVPPHRYFSTSPYTNTADAELAKQTKAFLMFHGGQVDPRENIPPHEAHIEHFQKMLNPFESLPYSFGARQLVARLFDNVPGFAIMHKNLRNYSDYLATSTFCLATAGSGWSSRYKVAVTHGCIPVIVQDGTLVEWEEILPIHEFAIRVPMWMVHRLDEILQEFINKGMVARMQQVLSCVWRLHWWRRPYGRAFELTMCELKRRLLGAKRVELDLDACTIKCGDDNVVDLRAAYNNV